MFGLSAALDTYTQALLQSKRSISSKQILNDEDKQELKKVTEELEAYGFRYQVRDPVLRDKLMAGINHSATMATYSRPNLLDLEEEKAERLIKQALGNPAGSDCDA
jgi:tRNA G18 (ribose-2'-O)-methylase SpoU